MKLQKRLGVALIAYALCANFALAANETEGNNDFSTRNIFAPGTFVVDGELTPFDFTSLTPDFSSSYTLVENQVISHSELGQVAGRSFFAAIDNTASGVDTMLGVFDGNPTTPALISSDDDGSPLGDGFASALEGQVNSDGSINLKVTGYGDDTFAGLHTESGEFDLNIYFDLTSTGDIDFLSFTGLTPGALMRAEITSASFDTILGSFEDNGNFIDSDDDGGLGNLSLLLATVSSNGTLNFAVSGYDDFGFTGLHPQSGQYQLTLTAVPVPAAVWLFGSGVLGLMGLGNRNRRRA